jgi:hypothetical protein
MKVDVTQEDIEQGRSGSASSCPVALAVTRATGRKCGVTQDYLYFYGSKGQLLGGLALPPYVTRAIVQFDSTESMKPFSFKLTEQ